MLNDKLWIFVYWKVINSYFEVFVGKIILDVGCGIGILSLFCVCDIYVNKVYVVEGSIDIGNVIMDFIKMNNL